MAKSSLRTPLGRVRGWGAAKSGTGDFIAQRVSGLGLALVIPYLGVTALLQLQGGYDNARAWAASPFVAPALALFMIAALYHMRIGMQVIIEDYAESAASRTFFSIVNLFVVIVLGVAGLAAIFKLYLGA